MNSICLVSILSSCRELDVGDVRPTLAGFSFLWLIVLGVVASFPNSVCFAELLFDIIIIFLGKAASELGMTIRCAWQVEVGFYCRDMEGHKSASDKDIWVTCVGSMSVEFFHPICVCSVRLPCKCLPLLELDFGK
ncbi:hypothetical protein V6N13_019930 [Hibiscus sabdariffa]